MSAEPGAEHFDIPVEPPDCWTGAMMYLCLLTHPMACDSLKRERLFRAFCSYAIRTERYHGRLKKTPQAHHARLLKEVPKQQMTNQLEVAHRKIALRLLAAEKLLLNGTMNWRRRRKIRRRDPALVQRGRAWCREPIGDPPDGLCGGWRWNGQAYEPYIGEHIFAEERHVPSVNHLVQYIAKQISMHERNVRSQVLVPARPVLHMAEGLRCTILERIDHKITVLDPDLPMGFDLLDLLRRPGWVKRAVQIANSTANHWQAESE
jgi:hypothetical protein